MAQTSMDPLNAQGFRTQRAELPEDLWQPLYDRANYAAAGQSQMAFFTVPRGQSATLISPSGTAAAKTKTFRDTNMDNSSVVPTKLYKFVGASIGYIHNTNTLSTNADDRAKIRDNSVLHFRIVDKDILYLPLTCIPEMNPIVAVSTTANNVTVNAVAPGGGLASAMYRFPLAITLNPFENFQLSIDFDGTQSVTTTLDVQMVLHSFMRRPT
jgi:hypothetical protein